MKLFEALERMRITVEERARSLPTPQPGLTTSAGPLNIPSSAEEVHGSLTPPQTIGGTLLPEHAMKAKELSPNAPPPVPTLKSSPEAQDQLTRLLYQTYACQRTYGEKAERIQDREAMFQLVLADFTISEINAAFMEHIRRCPDLPTPSDIYNILNPKPAPLCRTVYIGLRQRLKNGEFFSSGGEEMRFLRAFEKQEMEKVRG